MYPYGYLNAWMSIMLIAYDKVQVLIDLWNLPESVVNGYMEVLDPRSATRLPTRLQPDNQTYGQTSKNLSTSETATISILEGESFSTERWI